jgi:hypothetical protein
VLIGVETLLSLPEGLRVEQIELQGDILAIAVVSGRPSSCCPLCAQASSQAHSRYWRRLRDVPCAGRQVVLHLSVRKFFCRNPDCARKIFAERLPPFAEPWAQATSRLFEAVQAIGLATGGELGIRLANRIGFHTSPSTILGRIMALAPCSFPPVSCLGIDDWSFRRGRKFGTILVDLTTHTIIDLLPDRCAETSAAWMRAHPEIEMVSRDRGEDYAAAARAGAPQAIRGTRENTTARVSFGNCKCEVSKEVPVRCTAFYGHCEAIQHPLKARQSEHKPFQKHHGKISLPKMRSGSFCAVLLIWMRPKNTILRSFVRRAQQLLWCMSRFKTSWRCFVIGKGNVSRSGSHQHETATSENFRVSCAALNEIKPLC